MQIFAYGASSWSSIVEGNAFYVDQTKGIEVMERRGKFLKVWRPKRSGKSLFCNQLSLYYDANVSGEEVSYMIRMYLCNQRRKGS
jgi:Predicted AAA-ATPase